MDFRRYFDFAEEIAKWLVQWFVLVAQFVSEYWQGIVVFGLLFWFCMKILDLLLAWTSRRHVIATVNHKERVYYPKKLKSLYLVFTDKGVFRNQDSWAFLSFDSSDVYSKLERGSTYKFTIYLYRSRWSSDYPNILKINKCPKTDLQSE